MSANWSTGPAGPGQAARPIGPGLDDLRDIMRRRRDEGWLERFQSAFESVEDALGHAVDALDDAIEAAREVWSNWYRLHDIWYELPTTRQAENPGK